MSYSKSLEINKPFIFHLLKKDNILIKTLLILSTILLLILSAKISFRIYLFNTPIPITFQTLVVVLSGAVLGYKLAFMSNFLYLGLGLLSPVSFFSNPNMVGLKVFASPTIGYIIGFIIASLIVGFLLEKWNYKNYLKVVLAMFIGSLIILFLGTLWLKFSLDVSYISAISKGFIPFVIGDLIKIAGAAGLFPVVYRHIS